MAWFTDKPERLARELSALEAGGFAHEIDEAARAEGRLVLTVRVPIDGAVHLMQVVYPAQYPHFAFSVLAPDSLDLTRHLNPYSRDLCLLADIQQLWSINDTAAGFFTTQLPALIAANENPTAAADLEAHEAELITSYFNYHANTVLFTCPATFPAGVDRGYLEIAAEVGLLKEAPFRGAVLAVLDEKKKLLRCNHRKSPVVMPAVKRFWGAG